MAVIFEIMEYKTMAGRYVRATWPDGHSENIEDNSTAGPAFDTQGEAQVWIDNESAEWLRNR